MFIKITRSKNYKYAQLVRSYRENGTSKHEVLLNLGRLDEIENNPSFQRIAFRLTQLSNAFIPKLNLCDFSEAEIVNWGYLVYLKLWQKYKLDGFFNQYANQNNIQFDLSNVCFLMVLQHLFNPFTEPGDYSNQEQQERYIGLSAADADQMYLALEFLGEHKDDIKEHLFTAKCNLFNMNNNTVFCGSTAGMGENVEVDELINSIFSETRLLKDLQARGISIDGKKGVFDYKPFIKNGFLSRGLEIAFPAEDWIESQIKAYSVVCCLGNLLERTLETKIGKAGNQISALAICKALNSLNFAKVKCDNKLYLIKTKGTGISEMILESLEIQSPNNIMPFDEFKPEI